MQLTRMIFFSILAIFFISNSSAAANKVVVVPLSSSATAADVTTVFFSGMNNDGNPFGTDKRYAGLAGQSSGSSLDGHVFPMLQSGTITNFTIYVSDNSLAPGILVDVTLVKNESDSAISTTFSPTTETGVYTVSGTVDYAAGDTFAIYAQASAVDGGLLKFTGAFNIEY